MEWLFISAAVGWLILKHQSVVPATIAPSTMGDTSGATPAQSEQSIEQQVIAAGGGGNVFVVPKPPVYSGPGAISANTDATALSTPTLQPTGVFEDAPVADYSGSNFHDLTDETVVPDYGLGSPTPLLVYKPSRYSTL